MTPTAQQGKLSSPLDQSIRPDTDAPVDANNFMAIKTNINEINPFGLKARSKKQWRSGSGKNVLAPHELRRHIKTPLTTS